MWLPESSFEFSGVKKPHDIVLLMSCQVALVEPYFSLGVEHHRPNFNNLTTWDGCMHKVSALLWRGSLFQWWTICNSARSASFKGEYTTTSAVGIVVGDMYLRQGISMMYWTLNLHNGRQLFSWLPLCACPRRQLRGPLANSSFRKGPRTRHLLRGDHDFGTCPWTWSNEQGRY